MGLKSMMYPGAVKSLEDHKFVAYAPYTECINIMFDIETLGNDVLNGAPVTQIGVAYIDSAGSVISMCVNVDSEECIDHGLEPTQSTLEWISKQSDAVIDSWFKDPLSIHDALEKVNHFCEIAMINAKNAGLGVAHWGHSPRFDMNILERLYIIDDRPVPWMYNTERCWRTVQSENFDFLKVMAPEITDATKECYNVEGGEYHNAGYDAVYQVISLQLIINAKMAGKLD